MTQDIGAFRTAATSVLAYGEPTHLEPAFARIRNGLFARLAELGFRSIAIESDRVAGLTVDEFVRSGSGDLDPVLRNGFSHGLGELDANRQLVCWLREYNETRPAHEKLAFHGFDLPLEMVSAPSPRRYLEHARDYLGLDTDLAAGDDERWSRTEAVMDATESPGASPEADRLRLLADDLLTALYTRAPELIAKTSLAEWYRAHTHLTAGIGLLRYHRQSAAPLDQATRTSRLLGVRDAMMARNLLDIREIEASRGPTLVFAHNRHLQRHPSTMDTWGMDLEWFGAGAIVSELLGDQYRFVAGSLGASAGIGLAEPEPGTFEGLLQQRISGWGLIEEVESGRVRTDPTPAQGYFPLDQATVDGADAVLHVSA
ncbi:erythromycin esterase family protein [Actinophytocola algeriensis]|uniref:Erythromycin esterase-like protein n=1 Tax=Actinophytocola algeriensis TaxID=1768010 RepID=A0A7W7VK16_9PSEU|nr:erythromycin esterase family protein [Actinophytocola algeriensis]MBB4912615.1 erythromycin esterase-like protein [Actinophytocola algeriensis]MBE1478989.1 erythromycin esterase-like protein [Actinophytocola algeriensis]